MEDSSEIQNWNAENIGNFPGKKLPAVYVNRFQILMGGDVTRVVFGESLVGEDDANWSVALAMSTGDAIALAELILQLANNRNKQPAESDVEGATTQA
jgi:hypothetical protein